MAGSPRIQGVRVRGETQSSSETEREVTVTRHREIMSLAIDAHPQTLQLQQGVATMPLALGMRRTS